MRTLINCIYAFSFEKFHVEDPSKFLIKNEAEKFIVGKDINEEALTI